MDLDTVRADANGAEEAPDDAARSHAGIGVTAMSPAKAGGTGTDAAGTATDTTRTTENAAGVTTKKADQTSSLVARFPHRNLKNLPDGFVYHQ